MNQMMNNLCIQKKCCGIQSVLTHVHVDSNSQQEDANKSKVEDGVNHYGYPTGLKAAKLHHLASTGYLDQQTRCQENEEHH